MATTLETAIEELNAILKIMDLIERLTNCGQITEEEKAIAYEQLNAKSHDKIRKAIQALGGG